MRIILLLQGRLGNNLFQIAFLKYISDNFITEENIHIYGTEDQINQLNSVLRNDSSLLKIIKNSKINIWKFYNPNIKMRFQRYISKNRKKFFEIPLPFINTVLNDSIISNKEFNLDKFAHNREILIDGYFQFGRYINDINWSEEFIKSSSENKDRICMHIRRSDTFTKGHLLNFHCSKSFGYYNDCLSIFSNKLNIKKNKLPIDIFTDNKNWCENIFQGFSDLKIISSDVTADFLNMQNYNYYIISNSTFSYFPCLASFKKNLSIFTIIPTLWSNGMTVCETELIQNNWIDI